MLYTIYKITNNLNQRYYIGAHKERRLNDGYMGSGKLIKAAIKCYGLENFTKEILFQLDSEEQMYAKEAELVNEELLQDPLCYNINLGGYKPPCCTFESTAKAVESKISRFGHATGRLQEAEIMIKAIKNKKEKFGIKFYGDHTKAKATRLKRYGSENGNLNTEESKRKSLETRIKRYGNGVPPANRQASWDSQILNYGSKTGAMITPEAIEKKKASFADLHTMNNSIIVKRIRTFKIDEYLQNGWTFGRGSVKNKGYIRKPRGKYKTKKTISISEIT